MATVKEQLGKPRTPFLSENEINIIRREVLFKTASVEEILSIFHHLDHLEDKITDMTGDDNWRDKELSDRY